MGRERRRERRDERNKDDDILGEQITYQEVGRIQERQPDPVEHIGGEPDRRRHDDRRDR